MATSYSGADNCSGEQFTLMGRFTKGIHKVFMLVGRRAVLTMLSQSLKRQRNNSGSASLLL